MLPKVSLSIPFYWDVNQSLPQHRGCHCVWRAEGGMKMISLQVGRQRKEGKERRKGQSFVTFLFLSTSLIISLEKQTQLWILGFWGNNRGSSVFSEAPLPCGCCCVPFVSLVSWTWMESVSLSQSSLTSLPPSRSLACLCTVDKRKEPAAKKPFHVYRAPWPPFNTFSCLLGFLWFLMLRYGKLLVLNLRGI